MPNFLPFKLPLKSWRFPPIQNLLAALIGGICMGLTPAPTNAWFLAWVALAPLWILVVREIRPPDEAAVRDRGWRAILLYALLWGAGYHGLALFWITGIHPMTWMGVPWLASLAIAITCLTLITLWGVALVAAWAVLFKALNQGLLHSRRPSDEPASWPRRGPTGLPSWLRVLMGTALWCALESLWSQGPLWWSALAYTQSPHNLVILHVGQLSGPVAVTAAIVAVNGLLAEAWIHYQDGRLLHRYMGAWRYLVAAVLSLSLLHLVGFGLYQRPLADAPDQALKVGIIQGNIPNTIKLYAEGWRRAIEGYTTGYQTLAEQGVDAVLTPETALPFVWGRDRTQTSFYQAVVAEGVPVWLGAFGQTGRSLSNSLFTLDGTGATVSEYRKVKLVPLGEYIPFEDILGRLINRLSPLDAHLVAGSSHQRIDTPFGRAIVGICYESAYANHFRDQAAAGGTFMLTASNNAHYSRTMPAQHHAQDVMRAIETDRWAARATNTGYSGFVDPHGRTRWLSQINTYELHSDTIYRRQTQTPYVRWGDWLTPVLLGLTALGSGLYWMSRSPGH